MKITNPTVFLRDGELFCLTVEVPKEPESIDTLQYCYAYTREYAQNKHHEYQTAITAAKSSAVKVKNDEEALHFYYRMTAKLCVKPDTLYTLTGYEAEVHFGIDYLSDEEYRKPVNLNRDNPIVGFGTKVATISPAVKEESQEDDFSTWMDVCVLTHAIEAEGITNVIKRLQKHFTITRKK